MTTDDRFDRAARAVYAQAVSHVSAATTAELHRRRHAALQATERPRLLSGWLRAGFATAAVAAIALMAGQGLLRDEPVPAPAQATVAAVPADDVDDGYTAIDENPEFYLWLASSDATLLAME